MAEPSFLDPSHFHNFPEFNPSDLSFSDPALFPDSDDFALPEGLASDLDLDDIELDLDFTVEDLLNDDDSPNSNSNTNSSSNVTNSNPGSPLSGNSVVNETVKREEENNSWRRKRTKEDDDEEEDKNPNPNPSCRNFKIRRSDEANSSSCTFSAGNDEDERRKARLMRNRESAQLSRQRKKHYVEELEEKVKIMNLTIADLNGKISFYMAENARLHQQLNGDNGNGGGKGPNGNANAGAPPVVYPPLYPFPWIPYAGYPMRPNGHPVPYVAIPRLKPQQPAPAPKAKKTEGRKNDSKSKAKKVASVSLLGVFLIMMVFGGAMNFGGSGDKVYGGLSGGSGRVLSVKGRGNELNSTEEFRLCKGKMGYRNEKKENSSESLPALLYVPRNGKHVEINGNLIIHSVLASERAMAQAKGKGKEKESSRKEATGLVVPGSLASALAVRNGGREMERHTKGYRNSAEHPRALPSDSHDKYRDNIKSALADGPLQQWFREGLAGPILSSGTCTEVFQFEVSPSSAIVPATSMVNSTEKLPAGKTKNRRIMYPLQIPLNGSTVNNMQHVGKPSESSNTFHSNNSTSMVVSILADPREAGDGDGDGMITPKSLSRIFVVVLMDSVKYVTYSCVLPLKSHGPHLVN